jgi:hypothetical protein
MSVCDSVAKVSTVWWFSLHPHQQRADVFDSHPDSVTVLANL